MATTPAGISKNVLISELIADFPQARAILLQRGLHCVGCHISAYETLEEGCKAHGLADGEIDKLVEEIKESEANVPPNASAGELAGASPSPPVTLTPAAAARLKKMMEGGSKAGWGLRIFVISHNNAADSYEMDFEEKPTGADDSCECGGITVFYSKPIAQKVRGVRIDYRETVSGSGFFLRRSQQG